MPSLTKRLLGLCLFGLLSAQPVAAASKEVRQAPSPLPPAAVQAAKGDPAAGKAKSFDDRCQECHAHDGNATEIGDGVSGIGKFPKLAGQRYEYIIKQFADFREGRRSSDEMYVMASTVDEHDLRDIAAYFSSLKVMQGAGGKGDGAARQLFLHGDAARGLPACAACHSERSSGAVPLAAGAPIISGQHQRYLNKQLTDWRSAERRNSPGSVMNAIARLLSDQEIEALAEYISGL